MLEWSREEDEQLALRRLVTPAANDWKAKQGGLWHFNPRLGLLAGNSFRRALRGALMYFRLMLVVVSGDCPIISKQLIPRLDGWIRKLRFTRPDWLNQVEEEFIVKSQARRRFVLGSLAVSVAVVLASLSGLTLLYRAERDNARIQARIAESERIAAEANGAGVKYPQRRLLLAVRAYRTAIASEVRVPSTEQALRDAVSQCTGYGLHAPDDAHTSQSGARPIVNRPRPASELRAVGFSSDARWLATTCDGKLYLWEIADGGPSLSSLELSVSSGKVEQAVVVGGGTHLAALDSEGKVSAYNLLSQDPSKNHRSLDEHSAHVHVMEASGIGHLLATGEHDGTVRVWEVSNSGSGAQTNQLNGHTSRVTEILLGPNNRWLVSASAEGRILLWDLRAPATDSGPQVIAEPGESASIVAVSLNRRWFVVEQGKQHFRVFDLGSHAPSQQTAIVPIGESLDRTQLSISNDGRWMAVVRDDEVIELWEIDRPDRIESSISLTGHTAKIHVLLFAHDGKTLISAGEDGTVRLWDLSKSGSSPESVGEFMAFW